MNGDGWHLMDRAAGSQQSRRIFRALAVLLIVALAVIVAVPRLLPLTSASPLHEDRRASDLRVPPQPSSEGQWTFLEKQGARPVAYNPCRSIHYVLRVGRGPLNGSLLVSQAIDKVSAATGLTFVFDGMTDEVPQWNDLRAAGRPVWIGWADRAETDMWSHGGDAVGFGGSQTLVNPNGHKVYTTGFALLLPDNELPPVFGAGATEGSVLLHELGHVVGLDHVADPHEAMFGAISQTTGDGYGPGDLRGLWSLGASQGCL